VPEHSAGDLNAHAVLIAGPKRGPVDVRQLTIQQRNRIAGKNKNVAAAREARVARLRVTAASGAPLNGCRKVGESAVR
jgi:hypothetical protein